MWSPGLQDMPSQHLAKPLPGDAHITREAATGSHLWTPSAALAPRAVMRYTPVSGTVQNCSRPLYSKATDAPCSVRGRHQGSISSRCANRGGSPRDGDCCLHTQVKARNTSSCKKLKPFSRLAVIWKPRQHAPQGQEEVSLPPGVQWAVDAGRARARAVPGIWGLQQLLRALQLRTAPAGPLWGTSPAAALQKPAPKQSTVSTCPMIAKGPMACYICMSTVPRVAYTDGMHQYPAMQF